MDAALLGLICVAASAIVLAALPARRPWDHRAHLCGSAISWLIVVAASLL